ncbi:MAG TPA: START-like domain-containing protein [Flavobacteriales bacterium]|nr:START-like domain-containing protein [Flavobacteriales bacterium]HRE98603.1 START-like domain-containing protein [Flavobacteriales bacterium]HRJ36550.1 START-like domain-containing protein [Flavobacteriales bacterium]HRJ40169.1 START-like domain-containing protein [Flavobacteriales bacterium]
MSSKVKFELEFPLRSSNKVLFNSVSTPDGLSEWFADDVNIRNDIFIFRWDDTEERARLISKKPFEHVRFQWDREDEEENTMFEFHIKTDPLTKEVALMIVDHAEENDVEDSTFLWNNQINVLRQRLGA